LPENLQRRICIAFQHKNISDELRENSLGIVVFDVL